ncbi:MAG: hypothetical protein HYW49_07365 [Deltaproteobacteria bacterium]|nr:hypothetical protein [Deltaproteobacteria bacterium]
MKLRCLALCLFCAILWGLSPLAALAEEASEETPQPPLPWQFGGPAGKISNSFQTYFQRISGLPTLQERLDFELEGTVSDTIWTAKLLPWAWVREPDAIGALPRKTRAFFELKEGWVDRVSTVWDLRVGNQLISWGAADQINPTDQWNPRDLYDPLNAYKLPMPTAKLNVHPPEYADFTLEVLATPFFRASRLPIDLPESGTKDLSKDDSRWLLPMPTRVSTAAFSAPLEYKITEPTFPSTWQAGARFQALRLGGWDFSASYFNGVEKIPRMTFTKAGNAANPALPITLTLLPSFHRMQLIGIDGSGSVEPWEETFGLRFEGAAVLRDNSRAERAAAQFQPDLIKDDYLNFVVGVDHTVKKKVYGTVLYGNLMYVHYQRISGREQVAGRMLVEGLPNVDPWDHDLVLYLEDRINPTWKVTNTLVGSFDNFDTVVSPAVHMQIIDNLKASLGGDFFFGRKLGFFGQFYDNNRLNLSGSYSF